MRAVGVAVLGLMAAGHDMPLVTALRSWDAIWLLNIAHYGYDDVPAALVDAFGRHTADTAYAFFPGYPATVAAVGLLTGGNLVAAALLVTAVAGVVTAFGLVRLTDRLPGGSRRAGLLLVALFAAAPMGVVLSMAYTEALFCAFAVWALVGVLRGQWLLAGLCSAAAGLVRPTSSALALAVGLAALVAVVGRRDGLRPWVAGVLAASACWATSATSGGAPGRRPAGSTSSAPGGARGRREPHPVHWMSNQPVSVRAPPDVAEVAQAVAGAPATQGRGPRVDRRAPPARPPVPARSSAGPAQRREHRPASSHCPRGTPTTPTPRTRRTAPPCRPC